MITAVATLRVAVALVLYFSGLSAVLPASPVSSIAYVGLSTAFGGLGAMLVAANRNDARAAWLGGTFVLIATALSRQFLNIDGDRELLAPLIRLRLDAFLPLFLWKFVGMFPTPWSGAPPVYRLAVAVSWAFGGIAVGANLATQESALAWQRVLLAAPVQGSYYWSFVLALSGAAFVSLGVRAQSAQGQERQRLSIFVFGLTGGVAPFIVEVLLEAVIPAYDTFTSSPAIEPWVGLLLFGALATVPFSAAYSVFFDQVVNVRFVIRAALQYALARYTIFLWSLLPFAALAVFVIERRHESIIALLTGMRPLLLGGLTVAGLVALRFRDRWLKALDRRFFREVYDTRQALDHLLIDTRSVTDPADLEARIQTAIDRVLHANAALFVLDDTQGAMRRPSATAEPIGQFGVLMSLATANAAPMEINPGLDQSIFGRLPADDQHWLRSGNVRMVMALMATDGRAIGMLAMTPKQSGLPFSASDRRFIQAVGASTSLALENLRLRAGSDPLSEPAARECPNCASVSRADLVMCKCGSVLITAAAPYILRGVFRLDRRIGSGGMGVVYHAVDLNLDRSVAVKTLPRITPDHVERLRREARAMASIAHPNLAVVHGLETWQGVPFLIEEYLAGGTLANRLAANRLAIDDALDLSIALADALVHLHAAQIVHCDIKPSNIAFSHRGIPKLLDFGVARLRRQSMDTTETFGRPADPTSERLPSTDLVAFGTPAYMSPEALRRDPPAPLFDLWSLAVVLYESIAGRRPAPTVTRDDLMRDRADCPEGVAIFLATALALASERRPQSAAAFQTSLHQLRGKYR